MLKQILVLVVIWWHVRTKHTDSPLYAHQLLSIRWLERRWLEEIKQNGVNPCIEPVEEDKNKFVSRMLIWFNSMFEQED